MVQLPADNNVETRGGAHNVVITDAVSAFIVSEFDSQVWITMNELKALAAENLDVKVSRSTVSSHVIN